MLPPPPLIYSRQAHLAQWVALDERAVMPELLAALDSAAEGLCDGMDGHLDALLGTIDDMQPDDLLACLDAMAERAEPVAEAGAGVGMAGAEQPGVSA